MHTLCAAARGSLASAKTTQVRIGVLASSPVEAFWVAFGGIGGGVWLSFEEFAVSLSV